MSRTEIDFHTSNLEPQVNTTNFTKPEGAWRERLQGDIVHTSLRGIVT